MMRKTSLRSARSLSSASGGLFVTDEDEPPVSVHGYPGSPPPNLTSPKFKHQPYLETPVSEAALEDIAEELTDAIALFSRRCNRKHTPLTLRLSAEALENEEIVEALQDAERLGLGEGLRLSDGTEVWTIGPRS